jgi:hypothetical protein
MEEIKIQSVDKIQPIEEGNIVSVFESQVKFELAQRMASALSKSTVVPTEYRGNVANTLIALDMSNRLAISPMMVMQNLYVVNGRPSWSSQFIIAAINNSKRFAQSLKFKLEGKGNDMSCYAYTKDYEGEEVAGPIITMKMAKEEGWLEKKGSKWQTMPEVMIRYRSASFFGRLYCSDLLMGIYSEDESENIMKSNIKISDEVPDTFNNEKVGIETEIPGGFVDAEFEESKRDDQPSFLEGDESNETN